MWLRVILAFAAMAAATALGAYVSIMPDGVVKTAVTVTCICSMSLLILLIPANLLFRKSYVSKRQFSVMHAQQRYLEKTEQAINDLPKVVSKIVSYRRLCDTYSIVIFILSFLASMLLGLLKVAGFALFSYYLFLGCFMKLRIGQKKFSFEGYTDPDDFPILHGIAHDAAKTMGIDAKIRIDLTNDCNAGIAKIGKTYSLQLGAILLDVLTKEELYQVLIHEFAHMTKDSCRTDSEYMLMTYISEYPPNQFINLLYSFTDSMFAYEYIMYRITSSIAIEQLADNAILKFGEPQIAANALAKIALYNLFDNISDDYLEPFYATEQLREDPSHHICRAFRLAIDQRGDFWRTLLENEIQPRNASHPIFRNRIEKLGISDYTITFPDPSSEYAKECDKAKDEINRSFRENFKENYTDNRNEAYLKPLAIVKEYQESGKTVSGELARPIMDAMRDVGYFAELEELCDKIINETENVYATAHAHFVKGHLLLKRYNRDGLDHLYKAIDINKNYLDDGIRLIGDFCCTMGLKEDLEIYRERAVNLAQQSQDEFEKAGSIHIKDNLVHDDMPKDMLDSILAYINEISENSIENIYLVRKIITDTFYSSAFIVKFKKDTKSDVIDTVMEKIFNHLDTHPSDAQFSLFLYDDINPKIVEKVENCCVFTAMPDGQV